MSNGRLNRKNTGGPKLKKLGLIVTVLLLLYAITGFVIAPRVVQSQLVAGVKEHLGLDASVRDMAINPFELTLSLKGFELKDLQHADMGGFEELFVNVQLFPLFRGIYTFKEIRLIRPYGQAVIRPDGTLNFSDVIKQSEAAVSQETPDVTLSESPEASEPIPLQIDHLQIQHGLLEYHDLSKKEAFHAYLVPIELNLTGFTSYRDQASTYTIKTEIGDGDTLTWEGDLSMAPLRSQGQFAVTGLKIPALWDYVQEHFPIAFTDGQFSVNGRYRLDASHDPVEVELQDGEITMQQIKLSEKVSANPLVSLPTFKLSGIEVKTASQEVSIESISLQDGKIVSWLNQDGSLNYQKLFAQPAAPTMPSATESPSAPSSSEARPVWKGMIREVSLKNFGLEFEDRTPATPVKLRLSPLNVNVQNISTDLARPVNLGFAVTVTESGKIELDGTVVPDPIHADLDVNANKIQLKPFEPYITPFAQLQLVDGELNLKGKFSYGSTSASQPAMNYQGMVSVDRFAVVDAIQSEDFLKWSNLSILGLSAKVEPTSIHIKEIVAKEPYARVLIHADRTVNVSHILSPPQKEGEKGKQTESSSEPEAAKAPSPSPAKPAAPIPVRIDTVRVVNGSANFADFSLEPKVATGIQKLNGTVEGLSSEQVARATVHLEGQVDNYAPVKIVGKINPLSEDAFTDISLSFKNVELTTISPYSGKFAGYPIKKGKLSMDLQYRLSEKVLEAENAVHIDQLTLGEATDSPDATSLPVKLAIALLKDRHGNIEIDLPVRGNLNDPDFHYGRLLLNVLVNLVTKIVTSPFAALGSLLGADSANYEHVDFEAGLAQLPLTQVDKLQGLARALAERPSLRLEITGKFDAVRDQHALAETALLKHLRQLKMQELQAQGAPPSPAGTELALTPQEQDKLLRQVFIEQFGERAAKRAEKPEGTGLKPEGQELAGAPQEITVGEMRERLLLTIAISESDMRLLAQQRAKEVQQFLIEEGQIPAENLFLLDVEPQSGDDGETVRTHLSLTAN